MISRYTVKKIVAAMIAVSIALMQAFILLPEKAEAGGDTLSIRVQYAAEPGAKIREKAVITRSELSEMSDIYCYSNVTSVGTVMVMKARGAKVTDVISKAGIDIDSVKLITFRTDDGYTRNISRNQITGSGYYYPKLNLTEKEEESETQPSSDPTQPSSDPTQPSSDPTQPSSDPTQPSSEPTQPSSDPTEPSSEPTQPSSDPTQPVTPTEDNDIGSLFFEEVFADVRTISYYEKTDSGKLIPQEGFDEGAVKVPAVLALEFGSSKIQGKSAESLSMSSKKSYRFCIGQTKLKAGKATTSSDVTSMDSAYYIYGIDVTLEGYPVKGVSLSVDDPEMVIGSQKTVKAVIDGDSLFSEYVDVDSLMWSSSDESIATVNQQGIVTIKKKGQVTITATARGGIQGSIVLGDAEGNVSNKEEIKVPVVSDGVTSDNKNKTAAEQNKADLEKKTAADVKDKTENNAKAKEKEKIKAAPEKLLVKEVHIGKEVTSESLQQVQTQSVNNSSNAQALDEVESYSGKAAAGAAVGAICLCGAGAAFRIRRFRKEV